MKALKLFIIVGVICMVTYGGNAIAQPAARDLKTEKVNRALVIEFYDKFFNRHQVDEAANVVAEDYIQHNPTVPNGKEPFVSYYRNFFKENPHSKARIVRSAVDGDIVWLHVHALDNSTGARGEAVVDIFRVKEGKIVEHWDVIQPIPETAENKNTMF